MSRLRTRRYGGGQSYIPPLDSQSAAAAFSIRKVRSAYAGNCMRVRRLSDNTESDFGFDANGLLDYAAILAWAGTADLRVTTWYDQSGNANNANGGTTRPLLRDAQAWYTYGGWKGIYFNTFAQFGLTSNLNVGTYAFACVVNVLSGTTDKVIVSGANGGGVALGLSSAERFLITRLGVANDVQSAIISDGLHQVYGAGASGAQELIVDGVSTTAAVVASYSTVVNAIGGNSTGGFRFNSGMLEVIIYTSTPSGANRNAINANQKSYFGTA